MGCDLAGFFSEKNTLRHLGRDSTLSKAASKYHISAADAAVFENPEGGTILSEIHWKFIL